MINLTCIHFIHSYDGVPYVFHDEDLRRTTNVHDIFPLKYREAADNFTMDELKRLNAGSWFLRVSIQNIDCS